MLAVLRFGVLPVALAGCELVFPLRDQVAGQDAPATPLPDTVTPPDTNPALCFGGDLVKLCLTTLPTQAFVVTGPLDRDTAILGDPCVLYTVVPPAEDPDACVVVGTNIHVEGTWRSRGARPLVLVATESIVIDGKLDVSSSIDDGQGAGETSTPGDCSIIAASSSGQGGGAGGSLGGVGGKGGDSTAGNDGGAPVATPAPTGLRGGCRGGNGVPNSGTIFGLGGGAVALIAPVITITGVIDASGSAGRGGKVLTGGGGGAGSGGMILLDGMVALGPAAEIFANGGGGGEGAGSPNLGEDGGQSTGILAPGLGGTGGSVGGDGGDGNEVSTEGLAGLVAGAANGGGGGGGGGAGIIRLNPLQSLPARFSPPASFPP